jgi:hypothetical protein
VTFTTEEVTRDWLGANHRRKPALDALMQHLSTRPQDPLDRLHLNRITGAGHSHPLALSSSEGDVAGVGTLVISPELAPVGRIEDLVWREPAPGWMLVAALLDQARTHGLAEVFTSSSPAHQATRQLLEGLGWTSSPLALLRLNPQSRQVPSPPQSRYRVSEFMPWFFNDREDGRRLTAQVARLMFPRQAVDLTDLRQRGHHLVTSGFTTIFGAYRGTTLCGMVTLAVSPQLLPGKGWVTGLRAAPAHRCAELRLALLRKVIERAAALHLTRLDAMATRSSDTIQTLRRMGWSERDAHLLSIRPQTLPGVPAQRTAVPALTGA